MACRLVLVRHARTASNEGGLLDTRVPGPHLTDEGAGQAEGLVRALSARLIDPFAFNSIYVSTMVRTQLTAAPLAADVGLTPMIRGGIREISAGELGMRNDSGAHEEYLSLVSSWAGGDLNRTLPGGENGHEFFARFDAVVDEAVQQASGAGSEQILFISHGSAIRCWAAGRASNLTPRFAAAHLLNNVDAVILDRDLGGTWIARSWGDLADFSMDVDAET